MLSVQIVVKRIVFLRTVLVYANSLYFQGFFGNGAVSAEAFNTQARSAVVPAGPEFYD